MPTVADNYRPEASSGSPSPTVAANASEAKPAAPAKDAVGVPVKTRTGGLVYACFYLLGLGTLLPWNFFITAESYWQYKFRNVTDDKWDDEDHPKTDLQVIYTPLQSVLSQLPNFLFLFINALFSHKIPQKVRLMGSLIIMIIFFSLTTAFVEVDTDDWQEGFFIFTMIIIVIMNCSGAVFQGGLFGVVGMFPERYMTAVVSGQALGGVFASVARVISLAAGANDVTSALIYFCIAVGVMVLTLVGYLWVLQTQFYRHYTNCQAEDKAITPAGGTAQLLRDHARIFKKIWPLGVSVAFIFTVTLSSFPALCVKISSTSENYEWKSKYFQPVATFLLFNIGDYLGRQCAGWIMWPRRGSKILYVLVAVRVIFIPLFLLCNHDSKSLLPIVFAHDAFYIVIMLCFSLSNGFVSALCMMYAPKLVAEGEAEKASSMMAAMLGLGLLIGASLSFAFALIS
ncbi:equilibrative nucleoside transporter 1-like isoform X2 [Oratosquilla oratoria]|uniref:equilibrative nucleoside transporter 1-like isoform X2 n=1 Tax=Oratosquilla oratoria TaxID=337810 RepID=UPI003F7745B1